MVQVTAPDQLYSVRLSAFTVDTRGFLFGKVRATYQDFPLSLPSRSCAGTNSLATAFMATLTAFLSCTHVQKYHCQPCCQPLLMPPTLPRC